MRCALLTRMKRSAVVVSADCEGDEEPEEGFVSTDAVSGARSLRVSCSS